jgi:hypothetical protein
MHRDLIDQLWAYIAEGLRRLNESGQWTTYFPDQPLELFFRRNAGGTVEVTVGDDRHIVPYGDFLCSLAEGARAFFSRMQALVPDAIPTWTRYLAEVEGVVGQSKA